ncbi:MAG TPA: DUF2846 domain-containing protein [Candidatus Acidoferrales bacterium]|nr:DUF2846 domain-containing protein [Candidatus Acidoferrales bacterium]
MRSSSATVILTALAIFSPAALAQSGSGCGPASVKLDVSTTKQRPAAPEIQAGKALVYFLQDDLKYDSSPRPTTRFAVDGTWVGATHANSYFYVFVDPGEHHLCANWQSDVLPFNFGASKRSTAAAGFSAESGKTYYFRAQDIAKSQNSGGDNNTRYVSQAEVLLAPLDGDEAQVLMNTFSFSSSHPKK